MHDSRSKTEYLARIRIERFLRAHLPAVVFVSQTFHENVTDKAEAMRRWKPCADWLKAHGFKFEGVWQQQKRGAWHVHLLVNTALFPIVAYRAFVVARGWGTHCNVELVGARRGARKFQSVETLVWYMCRYLSRDFCGHVPRRVKLTLSQRVNYVGTVRFGWVRGKLARAWRAGCADFLVATGVNPMTVAWSHREHIMRRGFAVLGFGDWNQFCRERALARAAALAVASG